MESITLNDMKWFFFVSFIAALFCSVFWVGLIVFVVATHRLETMGFRAVVLPAPLLFFIWGALEMFRSFKDAGRNW